MIIQGSRDRSATRWDQLNDRRSYDFDPPGPYED
ncbi:hypothetical protein Spla01_00887 [Streptomyces platensis]|uniref:Uncharacterized protein n=1 Tax=Streptomyces platensis TaxID=58346 RepID=A0ABX3Y208_STRPT|nr:hypothetical protein BG653_02308 [Streptomyces platensis]